MQHMLKEVEDRFKVKNVTQVQSGDTVKVHQRIKEGKKERIQVFEGLVVNTRRKNSATHTISVRRIASGVGVEKSFKLHSPLIEKVEVKKRSKVRRNKLSYMRMRSGKSARLTAVDFDSEAVNYVPKVDAKIDPSPVEMHHDAGTKEPTDVEEKPVKQKSSIKAKNKTDVKEKNTLRMSKR